MQRSVPQLEELNLWCIIFTNKSIQAINQHCSRLKKFKELDIPEIPITSIEMTTQCAHALSRIRELTSYKYEYVLKSFPIVMKYMTGLRVLHLSSETDRLLVPHLLLYKLCTSIESIYVHRTSSVIPQQLSKLVTRCTKLQTLSIDNATWTSDAVLGKLARNCPQLQKVRLDCTEVTEEGVLTLAAHCRQLREIDVVDTTVTEETVRQLVQHCRHLTKVRCQDEEEEFSKWNWNDLRELR